MEKDVAILMADLTGYTAMTEVHGGESAANIVNKYMDLVDKSLDGETQVVQRIGDQVVLISDNPFDILLTAKHLNTSAIEEHHFLSIHSGIHYGSIFQDKGNLFGSTINVTARIMNLANGGQILCSSAFVNKIEIQPDISFKSLGFQKLKNVINEMEIFELNALSESMPFPLDPVCHMIVNPEKATYSHTFQNKTFYFCSIECMEMFKAKPEAFIDI
ncbi:MAG TPA: YHS domain-containing protein [Saprospiraceae bacterium]|nr:YHS domain-containing protein [Saprospiraceae bacterium]